MKKIHIYTLDEILNNLNEGVIPRVSSLMKKSGIKVTLFDDKNQNNVMSLIALDSFRKSYNIYIKKDLCYETQRFIAAYTYFYIGLYYDEDMMYKAHYYEELYDKRAFNCALRLLMPEKVFKEDISKGVSNKELARKYQVSLYLINERVSLIEKDQQKVKFKVLNGKKG